MSSRLLHGAVWFWQTTPLGPLQTAACNPIVAHARETLPRFGVATPKPYRFRQTNSEGQTQLTLTVDRGCYEAISGGLVCPAACMDRNAHRVVSQKTRTHCRRGAEPSGKT